MYRLYFCRWASTFSTRYTAKNEPILEYRRGSKEVKQLEESLNEYKSKLNRIPCIVDGKEAADLASDLKWRSRLLATTMLGQGKTIFQAEIDAACEVIDFWRFNVQYLASALSYSPISTRDSENTYIQRGLEGFVAAVSPFNFTAIGANLASSPALMGNTVLWKSANTAVLSNYVVYKILEEAGLPPGVI
ncbi:unnamed protein product, partial [Rotaria sp. Silwood2]